MANTSSNKINSSNPDKHKTPLKLYTKTGDKGKSNVLAGIRVPKHHPIFELLGTIDELNSSLGLAIRSVEEKDLTKELHQIQYNLLTCGALVAGSRKVILSNNELTKLEARIDFYQANTASDWYTKFLLPGGTELAARLDMSRTICRRAERIASLYNSQTDQELYTTEADLAGIMQYLNRLSDYLFALRCYVNSKDGYEETEFNS